MTAGCALTKENVRFSGKDTFGTKGRAWLEKQILPGEKRYMVDVYLKKIDALEETLKDVDLRIKQKSSSIPQVGPGVAKGDFLAK